MPQNTLERVAAGDPQAIGECFEQYRGLVWSWVRRWAGNHADAEDAVQEIFIDVWRNAGRFNAALSSEATFITLIARRRLIDRARRRARVPRGGPIVEEPAEEKPVPDARLEAEELSGQVRELMQRLRPEERQVLELSLAEGLSHGEIAQTTSLPLGTVKTHARRGLQRLRQMLGVEAKEPERGRGT